MGISKRGRKQRAAGLFSFRVIAGNARPPVKGPAVASRLITELDNETGSSDGSAAILRDLRIHLLRNMGRVDLTMASAAVGMSRRALQRKLQEAHTSFQAEHAAARVQLAKHLMRDTNLAIKRIAFDVGCSSLAAFSTLFRKIEGQSPSAWRNRTVHESTHQSGHACPTSREPR